MSNQPAISSHGYLVGSANWTSRYLTVRGDLRTYRIHLGSGNIFTSPNDQHLCIVAARNGQSQKLFLPFDDDPSSASS